MEVNIAKVIENAATYPGVKNNDSNSTAQKVTFESNKTRSVSDIGDKDKDKAKDKKELSKDEMMNINGALNSFMTAINSDLHFVVHDKTKELMMRVVDRRDNKVVKEIPSREMLDMIANIREYVGSLVDKRA